MLAEWSGFIRPTPLTIRIPKTNNGALSKAKNGSKRSAVMRTPSEMKYLDAGFAATAVSTAGSINILNSMAGGTTVSTRLGRQVTVVKCMVRLGFTVTAGTGVDQFQRLLLVQDHQANGAAPAITDVIVTSAPNAQLNADNAQRFKILHDATFHLNAAGEPGSQREMRFLKRLHVPVQYNTGNAGTVADMATNSMFAIFTGTEAAGVTAGSVTGTIRTYFVDN